MSRQQLLLRQDLTISEILRTYGKQFRTLTNAEKTEKYSNDVRSDLDLSAILLVSLPGLALNETSAPPQSLPLSFADNDENQEETSSDDDSDDE